MNDSELLDRIRGRVGEILTPAEGCHDFDHTLRVAANAERIAGEELAPADSRSRFIVRAAALLHDIGRPEEIRSRGVIRHEKAGAEQCIPLLRELGCTDEAVMEEIRSCILRHRYRGDLLPVRITEKIVYDADKLDSIGAIGIGRAFHFAGHSGARLHNTEAEALASEEYSRNDTAFREYLVKLRHVPGRMLTDTGRRIAIDRKLFMDRFFEELLRETAERPDHGKI